LEIAQDLIGFFESLDPGGYQRSGVMYVSETMCRILEMLGDNPCVECVLAAHLGTYMCRPAKTKKTRWAVANRRRERQRKEVPTHQTKGSKVGLQIVCSLPGLNKANTLAGGKGSDLGQ
jgi:hypothetical protein